MVGTRSHSKGICFSTTIRGIVRLWSLAVPRLAGRHGYDGISMVDFLIGLGCAAMMPGPAIPASLQRAKTGERDR
jgi:hypothetical protein